MTVAIPCPDRASLERLLDQGAGPEEVERLAGHLETCARCGETVDALLAADPTAAALRGARVEADAPPVQRLRARLANLRPAAASADTTTGANTHGAAPMSAPLPLEATGDKSVSLAPPQQPDEIGRLGGYRILKELGRGGMGVVYQAEDPKLKRFVALKAMLPNLAADPVARQRFLREAQAMAAVRHDHIVTIFQVDEVNGVPFLAMEFLQGVPLDKWLKQGRKPSVAQVLRIGREMAEGLAAAHASGLIHRDVKPGNVWLEAPRGRVKILDFGLARAAVPDAALTQQGAIVGTPAYMAPEQARGENVDVRSDLFSLGCVLYKLCTGALPFAGDTTMALLMALALDHPRPVRDLNPDVPAPLADLVAKLLAKVPGDRPQTAREVLQALQAVGRTQAAAASTPTVSAAMPPLFLPPTTSAPVRPLPREKSAPGGRKRRPWIVAAVAAGFLATAIAAAVVVIIRDKDGNKIAEVQVPPKGTVEVVNDGKKGDAAVVVKPAPDDAWLKQVAALPADKQVEAVAAKLMELNPGFDGKVTPTVENGVVVGLEFLTDEVTDIAPVRALAGLRNLNCSGIPNMGKGRLADLSPLKDMQLTALSVRDTQLSDLTPLKGIPLTLLDSGATPVSDLSPLKDMKLTTLELYETRVSDLSPLKDMKLMHLNVGATGVSDLSPLKGMPLTHLYCGETQVSDLSPLKGMPLTFLFCGRSPVSDLSPLKGMPLTWLGCDHMPQMADLSPLIDMKLWYLDCNHTQVSDLSPLKDMKLTSLDCSFTPVFDLSPLMGMPLNGLNCRVTKVAALTPLKDMKLTWLDCDRTAVTDLSPLKGMPLRTLGCSFRPERDAEIIRSIKTLETINGKPAAEFWKDVGATAKPPVDDAWVKQVAAQPADKQVEAVAAELKARNPGFDGKVTPTVENGVVVGLEFHNDEVTDISPVRALAGLRTLNCHGSGGNGRLADLSPLKDMKLTTLLCWDTQVSDLSPLKDMKLTYLDCSYTQVSDLSPLKGMPLTFLHCDLTPVSDLSPLQGMPLIDLSGDFIPKRDAELLHSLKTLERIDNKPAAEFWKQGDAKKP